MALSALTLAFVMCTLLTPTSAGAAAPLVWSAPASLPAGGMPSSVACTSEVLCVAVNNEGEALSTTDPTATVPSWNVAPADLGEALNAVSCAPSGPCVAVDARGYATVSHGSNAATWSSPESVTPGTVLSGVSCPSTSLCVAVDQAGEVLTSKNPGAGSWQLASIDSAHPMLTAVSCASPELCVAVDAAGDVLSSANPTGGAGAWHLQKVDAGELLGVSCWAAGACLALDSAGDALASADPTAPAATWSLTSIDGERLTGVSCAASGLCVAVDGHGNALASDNPNSPIPTWSASDADTGPPARALAGISCLAGGFCLALDSGHSVTARVPAPSATTLKPTLVTDAGATLTGAVDPNDAVLGACAFEYGIATAGGLYGQTIPCSVLPAASGGIQEVSAALSGLAANTAYHYRVLAYGPSGTGTGADEAFTTPVSSQVALVHPNPSITGTPANGQQLTCHPGTPTATTVQLSYAWLRDLIPIAEATTSTYTVKGQDTGHHLQCQVTATDGGGSATANSSFVTIPVGGAPASAGETSVGKAAFRSGKLSVPIFCSAQASSGCGVALRLTAVETLSGRRIVAIAARSTHAARGAAAAHGAALRHLTVTLASVRLRIPQGAHRTVAVALNTAGRRVLGAMRHFSASLHVSGTVIGVIEAQLAQQLLTLSSTPHSASTHAARRR